MTTRNRSGSGATVTGYLLCIALIPLYVSMFPLWKYLTTVWGEEIFIYLPALVLFVLLGGFFIIWRLLRQGLPPIGMTSLMLGTLLCLFSLLIPDPDFPVKRIHVAEYALLSLVARYAMSRSLQGLPLFFYSACFAAVLGIHDEFLQGFHPARTYGLRDMVVNTLGSFGGGLVWHGLKLFSTPVSKTATTARTRIDFCFDCWLLISVLMLVWPVFYLREGGVDLWTVLPLLATVFYFSLYRKRFNPETYHGTAALSAVSIALAAYPLLAQLQGIVFY